MTAGKWAHSPACEVFPFKERYLAYTCRPRSCALRSISKETLECWASVSTIVGLPLVVLTLILGLITLRSGDKAARMTNFIALTEAFFNSTNTEIIRAIDEVRPIRIVNGGKFSDEELDNYLGDFDTIAETYREELISEEQVCTSFSYYIKETKKSGEITAYIQANRREQPPGAGAFFSGLDQLSAVVTKSKLSDCK